MRSGFDNMTFWCFTAIMFLEPDHLCLGEWGTRLSVALGAKPPMPPCPRPWLAGTSNSTGNRSAYQRALLKHCPTSQPAVCELCDERDEVKGQLDC